MRGENLLATVRSRRVSRARYTSPIPPHPTVIEFRKARIGPTGSAILRVIYAEPCIARGSPPSGWVVGCPEVIQKRAWARLIAISPKPTSGPSSCCEGASSVLDAMHESVAVGTRVLRRFTPLWDLVPEYPYDVVSPYFRRYSGVAIAATKSTWLTECFQSLHYETRCATKAAGRESSEKTALNPSANRAGLERGDARHRADTMADQSKSPPNERFHIVLVPGFAGFDALGQLEVLPGASRLYLRTG